MSGKTLIWLLFSVCLVLSFLLSGMESGVFALSRLRIRQQMRAGRVSARVLHQFLENSENFLWTILVGNTVANFFILGWIVVVLHDVFREQRFWFMAVFAAIVFLFYAVFDLLPKMVFRLFPTRLCMALARPFALIHLLLRPLVALVEWFSRRLLIWRGGKVFTGHLFGNREELRLVMQESAQALSSEERVMINRVLDLQTLTVRQVLKPLDQAATITTQTPLGEALNLCRERKLTRLPVWEERDGQQRIVGLLSLNPLLYQPDVDPARLAGEFVTAALYLQEDLRLEVALRRMQRSGQRLAIVLGRDRKEIGILSLQDVLRLIFGEVSL
jgi:putative hemolysin